MDRYASLDSPLHLLEARSKLVAFGALIVSVLCIPADRGSLLFVYFFAAAILMGISQVPLAYIVGRTLLFLPFIALMGLAVPGKNHPGLGVLLIRAALCLMLLILLTNTTRFVEMLRALRRLGCPETLVRKLHFIYRYIFALADEAVRMKRARDGRRVGRIRQREGLKLSNRMLGTLLKRSLERADRMHRAMLSRGCQGDFLVVAPRRFSMRDIAFLAGVALFVALTFWML